MLLGTLLWAAEQPLSPGSVLHVLSVGNEDRLKSHLSFLVLTPLPDILHILNNGWVNESKWKRRITEPRNKFGDQKEVFNSKRQ